MSEGPADSHAAEGDEPSPSAHTTGVPGSPSGPAGGAVPGRRWGWAVLIGLLIALGVLLAVADIAVGANWLGQIAGRAVETTSRTSSGAPTSPPTAIRFDRNKFGQRFIFPAPFGVRGSISPVEALRDFLSAGGGLVLLALAVLVLFPMRIGNAVAHLEGPHGVEISLAAGLVSVLLGLAAVTLMRFSLILLPLIPVVLAAVFAAAVFGLASVALAAGRLLRRWVGLSGVHPLLIALTGALVVFDLSAIPYAGVFALAAIAMGGFGLTVVTRFGSDHGWSLEDLRLE